MKYRYAGASLALIYAATSIVAAAPSAYRPAVLPVDTVLQVRLNDTIGSDRSRPGDRFTATVEDPSLPQGTLVRGVITGVVPANRTTHGRLDVDFQSLELPSGRMIPMEGSPTALDSKSVRATPDGRLVATRRRSGNTAKSIGIGAAGGLLIGSLLGSNVVGGLLGGGAGYLLGKQHKAKYRNVVLKEGTELGVRLDQGVALAGG